MAARLLRKKETRVDLQHLLLNRVRKCIWGRREGGRCFKQFPALHALFSSFSCVTYTEVICSHQQTVFAGAQGSISSICSGTFSVLSYSFLFVCFFPFIFIIRMACCRSIGKLKLAIMWIWFPNIMSDGMLSAYCHLVSKITDCVF